MPRHSTFPALYDQCKVISITFLKKSGYLKPGEWRTGIISWTRAGNKNGSISFDLNMIATNPYFELHYTLDSNPISYVVRLVSLSSNLGKGSIWFFLCPLTNKRCRKLYLIGSKFLHRNAFNRCYYEKQVFSRRNLELCRLYDILHLSDMAYDKIHSKYFRTHYLGKPTKRYRKLMEKIASADKLNAIEIEERIYRK